MLISLLPAQPTLKRLRSAIRSRTHSSPPRLRWQRRSASHLSPPANLVRTGLGPVAVRGRPAVRRGGRLGSRRRTHHVRSPRLRSPKAAELTPSPQSAPGHPRAAHDEVVYDPSSECRLYSTKRSSLRQESRLATRHPARTQRSSRPQTAAANRGRGAQGKDPRGPRDRQNRGDAIPGFPLKQPVRLLLGRTTTLTDGRTDHPSGSTCAQARRPAGSSRVSGRSRRRNRRSTRDPLPRSCRRVRTPPKAPCGTPPFPPEEQSVGTGANPVRASTS